MITINKIKQPSILFLLSLLCTSALPITALQAAESPKPALNLYLNGKRLFDAQLTRNEKTIRVSSHEAIREEFFPLAKYAADFKAGKNTLAIHGYNVRANSSDFLMNPRLVEILSAK